MVMCTFFLFLYFRTFIAKRSNQDSFKRIVLTDETFEELPYFRRDVNDIQSHHKRGGSINNFNYRARP